MLNKNKSINYIILVERKRQQVNLIKQSQLSIKKDSD